MHLWTEYEGRTIAEHYTLGKLLRSEGRNGFFATADKDGHPAVIRLTEAHYDEAEQLRRWRQVAEVHQDNLIEIEQVGQTTFEGVALTYALMEPEDANLGDVLKERPLTTAETLQVAKAILPALKALHDSGLVHEHVEPANIMAVGETVKLRSDCVRECVADGEFTTAESCAELRRKDLHDYGVLLLRCLTLETEFAPAHNNLPDPFKRIIPKAMDGVWGMEQIGTALDPSLFSKPADRPATTTPGSPAAARPAAATPELKAAPADLPAAAPDLAPAVGEPAVPKKPLVPPGVMATARRQAEAEEVVSNGLPPAAAERTTSRAQEPAMPVRARYDAGIAERDSSPSKALWAVVALAGVLLLWLAYHFFAGNKAEAPAAGTRPAPVVSSGAPVTPAPPVSAETGVAPSQPPAAPVASPSQAGTEEPAQAAGGSGWYVVAFTYNHEAQAANKVRHLVRTHNSLHPQVFTPTGHGPYFVSLGGPMSSQDEAEAVWRHARRAGLPRDTFVRHY